MAISSVNAEDYKLVDFSEEYSDNVDVSGGLLIGYQLIGSTLTKSKKHIYLSKPDDVDKVEIVISTIDGVYSASMKIEFIRESNGWLPIHFPSEHAEKLKGYDQSELVAYGFTRKKDRAKKTYLQIFPVSWELPSANSKLKPKFFINSASSMPRYNIKRKDSFCKKINAEVKTAFNFYCDISEDFPNGNNLILFNTGSGKKKKYLVWN